MLKQHIILFLLLAFILSCNGNIAQGFLDNEVKEKFPERNPIEYITSIDIDLLNLHDNDLAYLKGMYELTKTKYFLPLLYSKGNTDSFNSSDILFKLSERISKNNNCNDLIIKIITQLNKKNTYSEIESIPNGTFKIYHLILNKMKENVDKKIITDFIKALPDMKLIILVEYAILKFFKYEKINYSAFAYVYKNINYENYPELLLEYWEAIFPESSLETVKTYIENISYYTKLQEFLQDE